MTTNWKTTLSGIGAALTSALTAIAALPYQLGDVATIIPPAWKTRVVVAGLIATIILKSVNSFVQKDASKP
jgi:hypothetical protein